MYFLVTKFPFGYLHILFYETFYLFHLLHECSSLLLELFYNTVATLKSLLGNFNISVISALAEQIFLVFHISSILNILNVIRLCII